MCKNNKCLISIAISIIIGVITAIVYFIGLLPGIVAAITVGLILAIVATASLLLVDGRREEYCLCENGICLVVGIIGTTLTGIIALAITLATASIPIAILIGLFGFFAVLTLISLGFLLVCIAKIHCPCNDKCM